MIVRQARTADIDRMLAIENRSFRQHRFRRQDFEYHLQNPSSILLVASAHGKVVGYIAGIIYHGSKNRIAKLYSMAVHPDWRRKHVGLLLLKAFEKESARRKSQSVTLEVRRSNRRARALYLDYGYKINSILKRYYNPRSDALRMRKRLKNASRK
jgi:ribosomal-protein-alanine acetyltransferase